MAVTATFLHIFKNLLTRSWNRRVGDRTVETITRFTSDWYANRLLVFGKRWRNAVNALSAVVLTALHTVTAALKQCQTDPLTPNTRVRRSLMDQGASRSIDTGVAIEPIVIMPCDTQGVAYDVFAKRRRRNALLCRLVRRRGRKRESARRAGQYAGEYTGSPCPRATRSIRSLARSSASSVIVRPLCSPAISAALSPSTMSTWHSPSRSRALLTHPPRDLSFDHKARSSRPACVAIPARGHALRVFFLPCGRSCSIFLPPNWVTLTFHRFAIFHTTLNTCSVLLYQTFRNHAGQPQKFTSQEE